MPDKFRIDIPLPEIELLLADLETMRAILEPLPGGRCPKQWARECRIRDRVEWRLRDRAKELRAILSSDG